MTKRQKFSLHSSIFCNSIFNSFILLQNPKGSRESEIWYCKGLQFKLQPSFSQLAWSEIRLFQFSTACTITFHTLEICQEPLGKWDGNDYVVLLIFQMSRERRKVWMYYYVLLVHFNFPQTLQLKQVNSLTHFAKDKGQRH